MLLFVLLAIFLFLIHTGVLFRGEEKTFEFDDRTRRYRVHLPSKYDPNTPSPLVIALHGLGDHPRLMEVYTGLSVKADNNNFIVVYPYGSQSKNDSRRSWNGLFCCGDGWRGESDDVGFLIALINQLKSEYAIDSRRIFMTGFSNGAMLTYRFAAEHPEILRAAAVVEGSMGGKATIDAPYKQIADPKYIVPLLVIHGKKDRVIPYRGGSWADPDASFLSVDASIALWTYRVPGIKRISMLVSNRTVELTEFTQNGKLILRHFAPLHTGHVWGGLMDLYDLLWARPHFFASDEVAAFFKTFQ